MATSRNKVKPIHVIQVQEFAAASNHNQPIEAVVPPTTTGKIDVFHQIPHKLCTYFYTKWSF